VERSELWQHFSDCDIYSQQWQSYCSAASRQWISVTQGKYDNFLFVNTNVKYIAPKSVHPAPKFIHKRHILGMSVSPRNGSHCLKLCHLSCSIIANTPSKVPTFGCFGTSKVACTEIQEFITDIRMWKPIHVFYFKIGAELVVDSLRCICYKKQNTFWHP